MVVDKDIAETVVAVVPRLVPIDPKFGWSLYHNTILQGHFPTEEAARLASQRLLQESHDARRPQPPAPEGDDAA